MMRGERKEQVVVNGRYVEAVPTVITVCGPDSNGCQRFGCDVLLAGMALDPGGTQFCDMFLTWEQARALLAATAPAELAVAAAAALSAWPAGAAAFRAGGVDAAATVVGDSTAGGAQREV
jgi:hypothetical protein